MDFFDQENYSNLLNIHKLNKKVHILLLELKEYEAKKKNNIYFLKIQDNIFEKLFTTKYSLLKKYYFRIIKTAIIIYYNKKKNKEILDNLNINNDILNSLNNKIYTNNLLFKKQSLIKILNKYNNIINDYKNFDTINNSKSNKIKKQYNLIHNNIIINYNNIKLLDIKALNSLFYSYICNYNKIEPNFSINIFNNINIYFTQLKILNIEFKEYKKIYNDKNKQIKKLLNINSKYNKILDKNKRQNELLLKKSDDIKNKYEYIQKYIIFQENKNIKTKLNFIKNIHELNIRIELHSKMINESKLEIDKSQELLQLHDNIKGSKLDTIEQCMICLEEISHGINTKCNHKYHYSCINLYIFNILNQFNKIEIKCPICRQFI